MIEMRDFSPEETEPGGFFRTPTFEEMSDALNRANAWIDSQNIDVINIETVVLPNMHKEEGTLDIQLRSSGEMSTFWYQFIRVWYRRR